MIDFWSFYDILRSPKPNPNLEASHDFLYDEGLTMGTLYIGRQGTGKTSSLALNIYDYFIRHPREAIFVLDWSGSITDNILKLILQDENYEELLKRVVYDDIGNPDWATTLPEFCSEYGNVDDQVQRVSQNLENLAPQLVSANPTIGGQALINASNFFKLLTSITNEYNESWQITEAKRLIYDEALLRHALAKYGDKVPSAKTWIKNFYMEHTEHDKFLQTMAIITMLNAVEPNPVKARIGYYRPSWTPREAIEKGLLVLCDGARLINQEASQYYLFTQVYSLIMQEINRRRPADPKDYPVTLVLDEVYSLLSIPGMASEISRLSPQYRNRKLQLYIVLQELAQMSKDLRPHIWSLGNVVCFAISNHEEAYEIAQQLFSYNPYEIKVGPVREGQHPLMEPDRGQYLQWADFIQQMPHRQCIMRRYVSEHLKEDKVQFVRKTDEAPKGELFIPIDEARRYLIEKRGVRVRDALEVISKRMITVESKKPPNVKV